MTDLILTGLLAEGGQQELFNSLFFKEKVDIAADDWMFELPVARHKLLAELAASRGNYQNDVPIGQPLQPRPQSFLAPGAVKRLADYKSVYESLQKEQSSKPF